MVGFCDLVGTGIAPVSKKTAVKLKNEFYQNAPLCNMQYIQHDVLIYLSYVHTKSVSMGRTSSSFSFLMERINHKKP